MTTDPSLAPATLRDLDCVERQIQQLRDELEARFAALQSTVIHHYQEVG